MKLHEYLDLPGNTQQKLCDRLLQITGETVTQGRVSQWLREGVPHKWIVPVAEATDWAVTPHEIDPKAYRNPDDSLPDEMRGKRQAA